MIITVSSANLSLGSERNDLKILVNAAIESSSFTRAYLMQRKAKARVCKQRYVEITVRVQKYFKLEPKNDIHWMMAWMTAVTGEIKSSS